MICSNKPIIRISAMKLCHQGFAAMIQGRYKHSGLYPLRSLFLVLREDSPDNPVLNDAPLKSVNLNINLYIKLLQEQDKLLAGWNKIFMQQLADARWDRDGGQEQGKVQPGLAYKNDKSGAVSRDMQIKRINNHERIGPLLTTAFRNPERLVERIIRMQNESENIYRLLNEQSEPLHRRDIIYFEYRRGEKEQLHSGNSGVKIARNEKEKRGLKAYPVTTLDKRTAVINKVIKQYLEKRLPQEETTGKFPELPGRIVFTGGNILSKPQQAELYNHIESGLGSTTIRLQVPELDESASNRRRDTANSAGLPEKMTNGQSDSYGRVSNKPAGGPYRINIKHWMLQAMAAKENLIPEHTEKTGTTSKFALLSYLQQNTIQEYPGSRDANLVQRKAVKAEKADEKPRQEKMMDYITINAGQKPERLTDLLITNEIRQIIQLYNKYSPTGTAAVRPENLIERITRQQNKSRQIYNILNGQSEPLFQGKRLFFEYRQGKKQQLHTRNSGVKIARNEREKRRLKAYSSLTQGKQTTVINRVIKQYLEKRLPREETTSNFPELPGRNVFLGGNIRSKQQHAELFNHIESGSGSTAIRLLVPELDESSSNRKRDTANLAGLPGKITERILLQQNLSKSPQRGGGYPELARSTRITGNEEEQAGYRAGKIVSARLALHLNGYIGGYADNYSKIVEYINGQPGAPVRIGNNLAGGSYRINIINWMLRAMTAKENPIRENTEKIGTTSKFAPLSYLQQNINQEYPGSWYTNLVQRKAVMAETADEKPRMEKKTGYITQTTGQKQERLTDRVITNQIRQIILLSGKKYPPGESIQYRKTDLPKPSLVLSGQPNVPERDYKTIELEQPIQFRAQKPGYGGNRTLIIQLHHNHSYLGTAAVRPENLIERITRQQNESRQIYNILNEQSEPLFQGERLYFQYRKGEQQQLHRRNSAIKMGSKDREQRELQAYPVTTLDKRTAVINKVIKQYLDKLQVPELDESASNRGRDTANSAGLPEKITERIIRQQNWSKSPPRGEEKTELARSMRMAGKNIDQEYPSSWYTNLVQRKAVMIETADEKPRREKMMDYITKTVGQKPKRLTDRLITKQIRQIIQFFRRKNILRESSQYKNMELSREKLLLSGQTNLLKRDYKTIELARPTQVRGQKPRYAGRPLIIQLYHNSSLEKAAVLPENLIERITRQQDESRQIYKILNEQSEPLFQGEKIYFEYRNGEKQQLHSGNAVKMGSQERDKRGLKAHSSLTLGKQMTVINKVIKQYMEKKIIREELHSQFSILQGSSKSSSGDMAAKPQYKEMPINISTESGSKGVISPLRMVLAQSASDQRRDTANGKRLPENLLERIARLYDSSRRMRKWGQQRRWGQQPGNVSGSMLLEISPGRKEVFRAASLPGKMGQYHQTQRTGKGNTSSSNIYGFPESITVAGTAASSLLKVKRKTEQDAVRFNHRGPLSADKLLPKGRNWIKPEPFKKLALSAPVEVDKTIWKNTAVTNPAAHVQLNHRQAAQRSTDVPAAVPQEPIEIKHNLNTELNRAVSDGTMGQISKTEIKRIADQVFKQIEQKIKYERQRRGLSI